MTDLAALGGRCFETYQTQDRVALEALLADDFTFTSPYDDHIDRVTYFVRCSPDAGTYDKFELQHVIAHGDACWVTYEGHRRNVSVKVSSACRHTPRRRGRRRTAARRARGPSVAGGTR